MYRRLKYHLSMSLPIQYDIVYFWNLSIQNNKFYFVSSLVRNHGLYFLSPLIRNTQFCSLLPSFRNSKCWINFQSFNSSLFFKFKKLASKLEQLKPYAIWSDRRRLNTMAKLVRPHFRKMKKYMRKFEH
jgi:hypothetical protein